MTTKDVLDGILIGAIGGGIAGISVSLTQYVREKVVGQIEKKRAYKWLVQNTSNKGGEQFRSTREIASFTNLTQERVRYLCSVHKKIFLSLTDGDMWSVHERTPKSVYEERGARRV